MKTEDPFEERLRRQSLRTVPAAWREQILTTAGQHQRPRPADLPGGVGAAWRLRLRELFWPAPQAWAGLAAVWLMILGANLLTREPAQSSLTRQAAPPSPQMRELLRQQEQLFAELVGPVEKREAERPKTPALHPRSQRREEMMNA